MKVLLIDVNCKYSSTGKIVYDLYTELNSNGHTAAICYGRGPLIKEPNILKFSSKTETYMHAFLTRVTGFTGIFSPVATRKLIKYMNEFKPDVVHLHELHGYFVNIAPVVNYLKKNNIKTIWTFHCEFMYTGKCGYAYDCENWKNGCGKCTSIKEYPASLYFDFTKKMFNKKKILFTNFNSLTIVTPSKWLASRVRESFLQNKNIKVINNGIDTKNIFYPRPFGHLKLKHNLANEKIVLAVAPDIMEERKGGRWVLTLAKKFLGENVKFILIGVNDVNIEFDDNVIALPRTSNQIELAEYYSMADVFVICSKKENFPTTCIEAVSCGAPVVGFDEGGTKETIQDEYGSFVKYGEIDSLAKEIHRFIDVQSDFRQKCSLFGRNNYSTEVMTKRYMQLYEGSK